MSAGDPGLNRETANALFAELKAFLLPFLDRLRGAAHQPPAPELRGSFAVERQRALCLQVLTAAGFAFDRGRMDESAHPYTTANDPNDIRFTTRYLPDSFVPALLSCLHEGGHGLHAQNAMPALRRTTLENAPYDALCESQSRYLENMIGRGLPFWEYCLPLAQQHFPQLQGLRPRPFYEALNRLCLSPNRLQADELSYNLHILIRCELEQLLLDGDLPFDELPEAWNRKYRDYLGLRPASDAEGVLQDMHWSSGYIGYFQSYVIGNFYDGHFLRAMRAALPEMDAQLRRGDFSGVVGWLREQVQQYGGMYTPAELLRRIDGEALTVRHYLDYLEEKYSEIYRL